MIKELPEKKPPNPDDTEGATAALIRAAKRAHLIAHQTGTGIVVMRDGISAKSPRFIGTTSGEMQ